jgi:hypothetical protein
MPTKFRKDELIQALNQLNDEDYVCPACELPDLVTYKGDIAKASIRSSDKKSDFCWCNRDD